MRTFWVAQLLGWPVAAVIIHGPHYERVARRTGMMLLEWTANIGVWALLGLLISTALGAWYVRQPERHFRGVGLLSVLGACLLGSLLWFVLMPEVEALLGLAPLRPPRPERPPPHPAAAGPGPCSCCWCCCWCWACSSPAC